MMQSPENRTVATSKETLTVYLPAEIKEALKLWSEQEQRSMAFLAERVITQAVKDWEKQRREKGDDT